MAEEASGVYERATSGHMKYNIMLHFAWADFLEVSWTWRNKTVEKTKTNVTRRVRQAACTHVFSFFTSACIDFAML